MQFVRPVLRMRTAVGKRELSGVFRALWHRDSPGTEVYGHTVRYGVFLVLHGLTYAARILPCTVGAGTSLSIKHTAEHCFCSVQAFAP